MTKKTSLHRATPVHSVYQNDYLFFNILILNGAHLKIFGLSCSNFPNHEILHQKFPKIRILWLNARIRLKCFRSSDWSCCQFLIENAVMKFLESFEFRFVQSVFLWFVHSSISHQFHFLRFLKIFTKSSFLLILGYSSQKVLFKTKDSIGFYTDFCHVIIHVRGCSSLLFTALSVCINCTCWSYLIKTNITTLKITGRTLFRYANGEKR